MPDPRTPEGREELRRRTREHSAGWWRQRALDASDGLDIAEREKAALAEAAIQPRPNGHKWCALCGMWARKDQEIDHTRTCVLANLSPAAKEILEKAQAHDAMEAENERLRELVARKLDGSALMDAPCLFCGYNGPRYWQAGTHSASCPWREIGGVENRDIRAALKEPE